MRFSATRVDDKCALIFGDRFVVLLHYLKGCREIAMGFCGVGIVLQSAPGQFDRFVEPSLLKENYSEIEKRVEIAAITVKDRAI